MSFAKKRGSLLLMVVPISIIALAISLTVTAPIEAVSRPASGPPLPAIVPEAQAAESAAVAVVAAIADKARPNSRAVNRTAVARVTKHSRAVPGAGAVAAPSDRSGAPAGMDWKRVEARIAGVLRSQNRTRVGLVVKDLRGGFQMTHNADARFASASLVKIPLAVGLFHDIEAGRIDRGIAPIFEEKHRIGGSGVLRRYASGQRIGYEQLLYLMLAKSDNTATNILTDVVGMDRVTDICREYGWGRTNMVRGVMALDL
jgi:beta-lactamase class A